MADRLTTEQRQKNMASIRSKDTRPEVTVRKYLFAQGFRFRKNVSTLPGTPDIVLPKYRTAIFVHGCFWHGHKGCSKFAMPQTNVEFWKNKIITNQQRDIMSCQRLESLAWSVITIWECDLTNIKLNDTMAYVINQLEINRTKWDEYRRRKNKDRTFALEQSKIRKELYSKIESELAEQFGHNVHFSRHDYSTED